MLLKKYFEHAKETFTVLKTSSMILQMLSAERSGPEEPDQQLKVINLACQENSLLEMKRLISPCSCVQRKEE